MRVFLGRAGSSLLALVFWAWSLALGGVDWLGRIMLMHDYDQALQRLPKWAEWLFATPWWVPATLASALTLFFLWLSWPRMHLVSLSPGASQAEVPVSQAVPEFNSQRQDFLNETLSAVAMFYSSSRLSGKTFRACRFIGPSVFVFVRNANLYGVSNFFGCNFVITEEPITIGGAILF